ncbi:hypothetical protein Ahy_B04g068983 isoform A [Arachis hypogaea]|uniref:Aminotransferase-like plant mobile domain-containing protein n=1 Tax=Arachis hypogaea TaxID=3818 RepID=A0A444ZBA0_ARAHY|nr:hypothetical protein Ahy_B04g068983 isoform A [Arachis hypogaea]
MFRPRGFDTIFWLLASRYLPSSDQKGPRVIATRLRLNRLGVDDIQYNTLEVIQSTTALIYFASIERHQVDRILSQLRKIQHIPEPAINIDFLLSKDGRGPTQWFPEDQRHQSVLEFQLVLDPRPSAMYLDWWFRVACRFFSHDRLLVDPHQGGIPADAPVRDHITALARQQEPNVPDNRCRITCEHVGTRYSQPMVTGFEDVLVLDEEQDIDDDDDDDGSNGGGGIGGGGFDWGWGGGSSGSGGGVSGSSYGVGGGNTRWGGAGGFVGPRGEGAGGLHLVVVPRVGGGSSQVETSTLFSDFGSPRQMGQVFGAGSDFLPRLPNLSAQVVIIGHNLREV